MTGDGRGEKGKGKEGKGWEVPPGSSDPPPPDVGALESLATM